MNWNIPKALLRDAQITRDDAVRAIADLLRWKHVVKIKEASSSFGKNITTVIDAYDCLLELIYYAVDTGDYRNIGEAVNDCATDALTYVCFEDWEIIVENAVSEGKFSEDIFLKVVRYLYDDYSDEPQSLEIDVAL
jgi:mevalonate kinase